MYSLNDKVIDRLKMPALDFFSHQSFGFWPDFDGHCSVLACSIMPEKVSFSGSG
jgi:hypothetical protein